MKGLIDYGPTLNEFQKKITQANDNITDLIERVDRIENKIITPEATNFLAQQTQAAEDIKPSAPENPALIEALPVSPYNFEEEINKMIDQKLDQRTTRDLHRLNATLASEKAIFIRKATELKSDIKTLESEIEALANTNKEMLTAFEKIKESRNFVEAKQIINQNITFEQPKGQISDSSNTNASSAPLAEAKCFSNGCCPNSNISCGSIFSCRGGLC